jgi:hypothetical protein
MPGFITYRIPMWTAGVSAIISGGWIEKKYAVWGPASVAARGTDTGGNNSLAEIHLIPYIGTTEDDPNEWNYTRFPYPKYKGGEKHFIIASRYKKVYHTGARGGCYYISATGRKVYVDSKYCKNVK